MISGLNSPNLAWTSAQFDVNTAADKAHFVAPFKCQIVRVFVTVMDGGTDAGGATIKFDKVNSSTRGDGDAGVLTVPASNNDSKYLYEAPATLVELLPGDQVIVEVTAEGVAALNVCAGIVYREVPEVLGNVTNAVAA